MNLFILPIFSLLLSSLCFSQSAFYEPRGIGGGGAMGGYAISPYDPNLRFIGTDMGTLFRSLDHGKSWMAIDQRQTIFSATLDRAMSPGFSSDGNTIFHAPAGERPVYSTNKGETWRALNLELRPNEWIYYFLGDSKDENFILAGTSQGLYRSLDKGKTWTTLNSIDAEAAGTLIYKEDGKRVILHSTREAVSLSRDNGRTFKTVFYNKTVKIRAFSAGEKDGKITFALIDENGNEACNWVNHYNDAPEEQKLSTLTDCGFVWLGKKEKDSEFRVEKSSQYGGKQIKMAENDPDTIYVTGGNWMRQMGTKVWVSRDAGTHFELMLLQADWDNDYSTWPKSKIEYSAIALEIGWWDNFYVNFTVNQRNSAEAGGSGYFFLFTTDNYGKFWNAPFTHFADTGERTVHKKWSSTGLEVTAVQKFKFHPKNSQIAYAVMADVGGMVTEDGGKSFRVTRTGYNTNYDYAFDTENDNTVFAAAGDSHNFPFDQASYVLKGNGGIFASNDRGMTWTRLTPDNDIWNRQFLSVAFDSKRKILYAGTQGAGIARSKDLGKTWEFLNDGMYCESRIIPQIEIDPVNGNAYALLSGDAPNYSNQESTGIYFLDVEKDLFTWQLLRGSVIKPKDIAEGTEMWWFPTSFAVDFTRPARDVLYLTDTERHYAWMGSGVWKTVNGGTSWKRTTQFTQPTQLTIDPVDSKVIYASGAYQADGSWGLGGVLYSLDQGESWQKQDNLPFIWNATGITIDPAHPENAFYTFHGAGMLYGPKPN